jgi:outer membrane lipoprotein-sorting protein
MKKIIFILLAFITILSNTIAQNPKPFVEKSDPEAIKILNKLRDKYKTFKSMKVEYSLLIETGDNKETQQGKITQKGDKFRVMNQSNEMICDGKTK